uniref:Uncharacterized protein n=1 Tax=Oryza meridionalis TaxID=40149 RepID=A0A0E0DA62_9ORYZ
MAEAVVFGILCKIGSILSSHLTQAFVAHLGKEVSVFIEIESSIKQIRSEFRLMQAFLQDGQEKESHSRLAETFLHEVQQVSFEVEDILDEFVYLFGQKQTASLKSLRNCFPKSKSMMHWQRLAAELKEAQNRLQNLRNLKRDCLQELLMTNEKSCSIISIWGMGGSDDKNRLQLRGLNEAESWDLFCMWAFRHTEDQTCPLRLERVARQIVGSIFPEDYMIHGKWLSRLLIAEGLVEPRKNMTLEEIATEYIEKLVDRCLLQVVRRDKLGRIWQLQMHDIVRELAISISEKEGFCMIYTSKEAHTSVVGCEPRRLSVHENYDRVQQIINAQRIRSFYPYQLDSDYSVMSNVQWVSTSARYLKVLELSNIPITTLPRDIGSLFNLHYLGLRRTKVKQLPESIDRLQNLRTLDIYLTEIGKLPSGVTRLRLLRHLIAGKAEATYFGLADVYSGVQMPNGTWQSLDINVFTGISASNKLVEQLTKLTQLRSLKLSDVKSTHYAKLFASISKMRLLQSLLIETANRDECVSLEALNPAPHHLELLFMKGKLHESVIGCHLFEVNRLSLRELNLQNSRLSIDPLPSLSNFCNLTLLGLFNTYSGESLLFQAGWFPKLQTLTLAELQNVNSIVIQEYSMPNLYNLALICLKNLEYLPQGMEFLKSVEEFNLVGMHHKFMEDVQAGSSYEKVKHIPVVDYFDQSKGRWDRLSRVYGKGNP